MLHTVAGRPAALVDRLPGAHPLAPDAQHCAALGETLARMHLAGADFALQQPNPRGLAWIAAAAPVVAPHLDAPRRALLEGELAHAQHAATAFAALPRGTIHADLFRDNTLFVEHRLTGVFDFYFAGVDALLLDIAVCLNDWCIALDSGRLDDDRAAALVQAYASVRPLAGAEMRLLPAMLRLAALRFWVSRLADLHLPRAAHLLQPHDPGHFERVLRARAEVPWHPAA
jgi:homoserine kinase type II